MQAQQGAQQFQRARVVHGRVAPRVPRIQVPLALRASKVEMVGTSAAGKQKSTRPPPVEVAGCSAGTQKSGQRPSSSATHCRSPVGILDAARVDAKLGAGASEAGWLVKCKSGHHYNYEAPDKRKFSNMQDAAAYALTHRCTQQKAAAHDEVLGSKSMDRDEKRRLATEAMLQRYKLANYCDRFVETGYVLEMKSSCALHCVLHTCMRDSAYCYGPSVFQLHIRIRFEPERKRGPGGCSAGTGH